MNQEKNVESIGVQNLKKHERQSKNILTCGIKEESMETLTYLGKVIGEFFNMHYSMVDVNVHGAHKVGKHNVAHSRERPIVCTMADDTK